MKPTLFVLAAGMGSRYGGLKQIDGLGPHGETIMDYSIYDAVRAGFGKVVFVIREDFANDFKQKVSSKYEGILPVDIVYQDARRVYLPPRPHKTLGNKPCCYHGQRCYPGTFRGNKRRRLLR